MCEDFDVQPNDTTTNEATTHATKRCYTVDDLMVILGISRGSVYALLKRKDFHWVQLCGGQYRISKKSFDEWLDQAM